MYVTDATSQLDADRSPIAISVTVSLVLVTAQWTGVRPVGDIAMVELALVGAVVALGFRSLRVFVRTAPWVLWTPVVVLVGLEVMPGRDDAELIGVTTAGSLFVCFYVVAEGPRRGRIPWLTVVDLVVWSSLVNAAVAVASAVTDGVVAWPTAPEFPGREVGLTVHPNQLALFCLLGLSMLLFRSLDDHATERRVTTMRARLAVASPAVVLAFGVLASGSRAGLGVGGVLVVLWMWTESGPVRSLAPRGARAVVAVGLGLVVLVATSPVLAGGRLLGLSDRTWQSFAQSDGLRSGYFRTALDAAQRSPITGAGSDHLLAAHNLPLQLLAAGGVVLLAAFVPMLWTAVRPAFARVPFGPSVAVTAWLAFSMVQNPILDRFVHLMIAIAVVAQVRPKRPLTPCVESSV